MKLIPKRFFPWVLLALSLLWFPGKTQTRLPSLEKQYQAYLPFPKQDGFSGFQNTSFQTGAFSFQAKYYETSEGESAVINYPPQQGSQPIGIHKLEMNDNIKGVGLNQPTLNHWAQEKEEKSHFTSNWLELDYNLSDKFKVEVESFCELQARPIVLNVCKYDNSPLMPKCTEQVYENFPGKTFHEKFEIDFKKRIFLFELLPAKLQKYLLESYRASDETYCVFQVLAKNLSKGQHSLIFSNEFQPMKILFQDLLLPSAAKCLYDALEKISLLSITENTLKIDELFNKNSSADCKHFPQNVRNRYNQLFSETPSTKTHEQGELFLSCNGVDIKKIQIVSGQLLQTPLVENSLKLIAPMTSHSCRFIERVQGRAVFYTPPLLHKLPR